MSAHAWWRIKITAPDGNVWDAIVALDMHTSQGGANVCTGGTAFASSQYSGTYSADKAFDGNSGTFWNNGTEGPPTETIGYHFASPVNIVEIMITATTTPSCSPKDFTIEYSDDGAAYSVLATITGSASWGVLETRTFWPSAVGFTGDIEETTDITNWRIVAFNMATGAVYGTTTSGEAGTTYTITGDTITPCILMMWPKIDREWSATTVVALNDYCIATDVDTNDGLYKATNRGSSPYKTGATEPAWPGTGTIADGDITWTFIAQLVDPVCLGPKLPV